MVYKSTYTVLKNLCNEGIFQNENAASPMSYLSRSC